MTLTEAEALLEARFCGRMAAERVPLPAACGRVLAEDLRAGFDLPGFARSAVDGYALRASDTFGCTESMPALLRLLGSVEMGRAPAQRLEPGGCVYVPTGGALPEGADAVVMLEYAEAFGDSMAIGRPAAPGQHLLLRGEDMRAGEPALPAGRVLQPRDIGVAAALGCETLPVRRRPRAVVLSTGDEVVPVGGRPGGYEIFDANGPMLAAQAAACGAEAVYLGVVPDGEDALEAALRAAAEEADVLLLSGGSSAGAQDAAEAVLSRLGRLLFHGLALKPGKPTLAADMDGLPVIGLPGHPAAACMVFHALARGLILRMLGARWAEDWRLCRLTQNLPSNHGREELVAVRGEGEACSPLISKSGLLLP
ncbi:MAG: molybdopterin molybdotransferase MoeA, partial [Clostridia bacterium]|nr:molybdopterin molybdotransferase MoeA [Clostridia bacterium]